MIRLPRGRLIVRPDAPDEVRGTIQLVGAEERPWGTVLMHNAVEEVEVSEGDRVRYKQYAGTEVELLWPDAPDVHRCRFCGARSDAPNRSLPCQKHTDAATGEPLPHDYVNVGREAETLLVLLGADVVVVEAQPDA